MKVQPSVDDVQVPEKVQPIAPHAKIARAEQGIAIVFHKCRQRRAGVEQDGVAGFIDCKDALLDAGIK